MSRAGRESSAKEDIEKREADAATAIAAAKVMRLMMTLHSLSSAIRPTEIGCHVRQTCSGLLQELPKAVAALRSRNNFAQWAATPGERSALPCVARDPPVFAADVRPA